VSEQPRQTGKHASSNDASSSLLSSATGLKERLEKALEPFDDIGQWLFARPDVPDDTPMVDVSGINGQRGALTRGHFKAAHLALRALREAAAALPEPLSDGLKELIEALRWQASENGCYCETDGPAEESGIPIAERCPYCLMGMACLRLQALPEPLLESLSVKPYDFFDGCTCGNPQKCRCSLSVEEKKEP
jgi:hypothetical protein